MDYQLQSTKTLTSVTSKLLVLNETHFMRGIFNTIEKKTQTVCEMQDETYVKNFVSSWGTLFGRATDNLKSLAKNILRVILKD